MDPPDGSDTRPAETPAAGSATAQAKDAETTAEPVSLVPGLTITDAPAAAQSSNPDDNTPADLSITAPVTVFKRAPDAPPESPADTPTPPPKAPKICGVCDKEPGKYKCPRCGMSYCSVPCSKLHKANHPPDAPPPSQPPPAPVTGTKRPREPADDPYSILLEHRSDLERLFTTYPNLESDLIQIERATLPPPDILSSASVSSGLPTKYQPPDKRQQQEPWTRQVGLRKGVAALKRARLDPGEDGDAVREYCELVLHLLSTSRERREGEALEAVRRETETEERGVIKRLIKMEEGDE
ncbi:hypothetical protein CONLIGDRAFT_704989 [Coniochaeta ligniaria NRRL 30616]|uniref:HIT-type domain-containing protein n=1 Tax=Coniochaeta ligniaria NRRL 30616 TaxID=1408157 RepID=A0A1J7JDH3_9PEZI|nr:hypothetical protein CONLIGDRAFT_704989 [Coniochaeta ligniaria NRRL 30616]